MQFPILKILTEQSELTSIFPEGPSEKGLDKANLEKWTFQTTFGNYIVSFIDAKVHKVIYQINSDTDKKREDKYYFILGQYQEKSQWKFLVDNGMGYLFSREDGALHAAYSYVMDIWTIETTEFRKMA